MCIKEKWKKIFFFTDVSEKKLRLSLGRRMDITHVWATSKLLYFTNLIQDIFQHEKTLSLLKDSNISQKTYCLGFLLFFLWLFFLKVPFIWWWRGNDVLFVPRQESSSRGDVIRHLGIFCCYPTFAHPHMCSRTHECNMGVGVNSKTPCTLTVCLFDS